MQTMYFFGMVVGAVIGTVANEAKWQRRETKRIKRMLQNARIRRSVEV